MSNESTNLTAEQPWIGKEEMEKQTVMNEKAVEDSEVQSQRSGERVRAGAGAVGGEGHLQRQLKNRHVQMISLGGVIGTGLFLGTARSLADGGPLGLLLAYTIMSSVCIGVMLSVGETVTYLPIEGGLVTLSGRFVDPALAFAMGWNYWYSWCVTLPAELSAAAVIVDYWNSSINSAVWITIFLIVVVVINFIGTRAFGEAEFWFASIKVVAIVGLIILGVVIDLGGAPDHDRLGFRYWKNPGPFTHFLEFTGPKGRFLGFWNVLIQAAYAFMGTEIIGISAAETRNPKRTIPRAVKSVYMRITLFYILGVFILGLICPSNDGNLVLDTGTAASSAWVVAIQRSGIKVLPSIINAAVLTAAWSAGSSSLYTASRTLYGLAAIGQAPHWVTYTDRRGTPYIALGFTALFGLLSYTGVSSGSSRVFTWFANMSAVSGIIAWMGICLTAIRFRWALKAQGLGLDVMPYRSRLMPFMAWWSLVWSIVVALFANWSVFLKGQWDTAGFVSNYLPIPVFLVLYLGYKIVYRTRLVSLKEMDLVTGVQDS